MKDKIFVSLTFEILLACISHVLNSIIFKEFFVTTLDSHLLCCCKNHIQELKRFYNTLTAAS